MRPIEEIGKGKGRSYGGTPYYGRGYVQTTYETNYAKASKALVARDIHVDLVAHPEKALDPTIAAYIMFDGMQHGMFTGKKLADYIPHDPVNARRIINGTDRAQTVASYYTAFNAALRTVVDVPAPKAVAKLAPTVVAPLAPPAAASPAPLPGPIVASAEPKKTLWSTIAALWSR